VEVWVPVPTMRGAGDVDADVAASDLLAGLPRPPLTASATDVVAAPVHRSN